MARNMTPEGECRHPALTDPRPRLRRSLRDARGIVACTLIMLAGCEKYALNDQMAELCRRDGGNKVYEQVALPSASFDGTGMLILERPSSRSPTGGVARSAYVAGGAYRVDRSYEDVKKGDPFDHFISEGRLRRHKVTVLRVADSKVLGEGVLYVRTGGELTPFGMPSTTECPNAQKDVVDLVFTRKAN